MLNINKTKTRTCVNETDRIKVIKIVEYVTLEI